MDTTYCILVENSNKSFDWFTSVSLTIAFLIFVAGLYQYWKAQRWKRTEFLISLFKDLENTYEYKNAIIMLEWKNQKVELYPYKSNIEERFDEVSIDEQIKALGYSNKDVETMPKLIRVRYLYDRLFSLLARIEEFISKKLIIEKEILPHLKYYLKLLNADIAYEKNLEFSTKVYEYLKKYNFLSTINLLKRAKKT